MKAYNYDESGWYTFEQEGQQNPLEPGVWMKPEKSTFTEPPAETDKKSPKWDGKKWVLTIDPLKMTLAEKVDAGLEARPKGYILDGDAFRPATYDEQVTLGDLTSEVAYTLKLRDCLSMRQSSYQMESDPIMAQYLRGEATKEEWLAKIEEIKVHYPKPVAP